MKKENKSAKKSAKKVVKSAKKTVKKTTSKAPKVNSAKKKIAKKLKVKRKPETLMCFLTTACVNYYSLPDDGYELNTLRNYRDTYLASSQGGEKLIQEYYRVSPGIVLLINKDQEKKSVYEYIYSQIKLACSEIENKNLLFAKKVYTTMVKRLMKKYSLN